MPERIESAIWRDDSYAPLPWCMKVRGRGTYFSRLRTLDDAERLADALVTRERHRG